MNYRLTEDEFRFCTDVSSVVQSNPFEEYYFRKQREVVGVSDSVDRLRVVLSMSSRLSHFSAKLKHEKRSNMHHYSPKEQAILVPTLLFDIFHRFVEQMDSFILQQIEVGERSLRMPFKEQLYKEFCDFGFQHHETLLYIAMIFQMRRAFYFIDRNMPGNSPSICRLRKDLWNAVFTNNLSSYKEFLLGKMEDFSTLILGETGTGKGTAALAIGRSGFIPFDYNKGIFVESFQSAFVPINLSEFPETLLESELFGHAKGAFTGAVATREGIFGRCSSHGSIFLDEIGDISLPVQVKLLRVIQERNYRSVGSFADKSFGGRVIAATHQNIETLLYEGQFRDDLYYRLCSNTITIPTLQERLQEDPQELERLIKHLVIRIVGKGFTASPEEIAKAIRSSLGEEYGWKGNIRELEQVIRRYMLTGSCDITRPAAPLKKGSLEESIRKGDLSLDDIRSIYCQMLYDQYGSWEKVARIGGIDRRTVKKLVMMGE